MTIPPGIANINLISCNVECTSLAEQLSRLMSDPKHPAGNHPPKDQHHHSLHNVHLLEVVQLQIGEVAGKRDRTWQMPQRLWDIHRSAIPAQCEDPPAHSTTFSLWAVRYAKACRSSRSRLWFPQSSSEFHLCWILILEQSIEATAYAQSG